MGMFDEVRAINISHKNFDRSHNGCTFQTKDLELFYIDPKADSKLVFQIYVMSRYNPKRITNTTNSFFDEF